jgi:hypothetical protein
MDKKETTRKNIQALLITGKEFGLKINDDKNMCMIMSQQQNTV